MPTKPTLVIMAAGMGSRFGGPKQITPIDAQGHIIIDYSIYDAIRAGFGKVVCIVNRANEADFRTCIGDRIAPHVDLVYAYQQLDMLPAGFSIPEGRVKPWGTAHAVLCAKDAIHTPFAVINADDYYGPGAMATIHDFLAVPRASTAHAMVGYRIENTLSPSGYVARGICEVDENGTLLGVVERTHIEPRPGGAAYTEDGLHHTFLPEGTIVSMNLWGFQHAMLHEIESRFPAFLAESLPDNPLKCEYFLPLIPNQLIHEGAATVAVLPTPEQWFGVTYREDLPMVQAAIAEKRRAGIYPTHLWR